MNDIEMGIRIDNIKAVFIEFWLLFIGVINYRLFFMAYDMSMSLVCYESCS